MYLKVDDWGIDSLKTACAHISPGHLYSTRKTLVPRTFGLSPSPESLRKPICPLFTSPVPLSASRLWALLLLGPGTKSARCSSAPLTFLCFSSHSPAPDFCLIAFCVSRKVSELVWS